MGRYRKVDTRIWNDAKFRGLSDDAKLAFLFVLTHPHMTSLGAMRASIPGLAKELGWTSEALRIAFRKPFAKGLIEYDEGACFLALPSFLKYNKPESPNVVKSWINSLDLIPECKGKVLLLQRVTEFLEALPEAFSKALPKAFRKAMPNQEQEQEQEQEHEQDKKKKVSRGYPDTFELFWTAYPRRQSKGQALRAWPAAIEAAAQSKLAVMAESPEAFLIRRAADYGAATSSTEKKYIRLPATWLNGHGWEDEIGPRVPTDEELEHWSPSG